MVHFDLGGVRHRVADYSALALLARLENGESDVTMEIARSLSRALVRGASTDIILDENGQAELYSRPGARRASCGASFTGCTWR